MARAIRDAAGRAVHVGDTVGGVTPAPGHVTITGEVDEVRTGRVLVAVATAAAGTTPADSLELPAAGTLVWLPARRMFLIHGQAVQGQQVRSVTGPLKSLHWSGRRGDIQHAATFTGDDLIGAVLGNDGFTLLLRVSKARPKPELVPPGWFILRPPGRVRARACDPEHYATAYAPIAPDNAT